MNHKNKQLFLIIFILFAMLGCDKKDNEGALSNTGESPMPVITSIDISGPEMTAVMACKNCDVTKTDELYKVAGKPVTATSNSSDNNAKTNTYTYPLVGNDADSDTGVLLVTAKNQYCSATNTTITAGYVCKTAQKQVKVKLDYVKKIFSGGAFAALKTDGSVVTWGDSSGGGNYNYSGVDVDENSTTAATGVLSSGVVKIFSTDYAFAALKEDGSVVTWGASNNGGDFVVSNFTNATPAIGDLTNVKQIFSTDYAFAALKEDGSVVTWGSSKDGGDSSTFLRGGTLDPKSTTNPGVVKIFSTTNALFSGSAFAALKEDGSVVTWGASGSGGDYLSNADKGFYGKATAMIGDLSSGVKEIFSNSTQGAFAALKEDGSVVTWGGSGSGGDSSTLTGGTLDSKSATNPGVVKIFSNNLAFAALKEDGSVVTWGNSFGGGNYLYSGTDDSGENITAVTGDLTNVKEIFSTEKAFAALKTDGSVVTWGGMAVIQALFKLI